MEHENISQRESDFAFLEKQDIQEHFAVLNLQLLQGGHVQRDNYYSFKLLGIYEGPIRNYYRRIHGLELVKDKTDNESYFYLDFIGESKGKTGSSVRSLTDAEIVYSIMLMKMYYERYFEAPKEIKWEDIRKEIMESENNVAYRTLLFDSIRTEYSENEWKQVKNHLKRALRDLSTLGWIKRLAPEEGDEIHFIIKESVHRFARLYDKEINQFDAFSKAYHKSKAEE